MSKKTARSNDFEIQAGRILFIGFDYHEYTREIVSELQALGFGVDFYSIQPESIRLKFERRANTQIYQKHLNKIHADIVSASVGVKYDFVIFLQVHQFSYGNLKDLRRNHVESKFILYNWDAVATHDYLPYMDLFDSIYTFDPVDASMYNIGYLPLFCIRRFQKKPNAIPEKRSVYFVGNVVNPKRYFMVKKFDEYCSANRIKFEKFLSANLSGMTGIVKNGAIPCDVSYFSISQRKFLDMMNDASAVFDFANHEQSGHTMRVMENLCAGKRIITNNRMIEHSEFYSEDRVFIYDGTDFSGIDTFLDSDLKYPGMSFSEYYVQSFVKRLLE